jgi:hypothetical protein
LFEGGVAFRADGGDFIFGKRSAWGGGEVEALDGGWVFAGAEGGCAGALGVVDGGEDEAIAEVFFEVWGEPEGLVEAFAEEVPIAAALEDGDVVSGFLGEGEGFGEVFGASGGCRGEQ